VKTHNDDDYDNNNNNNNNNNMCIFERRKANAITLLSFLFSLSLPAYL